MSKADHGLQWIETGSGTANQITVSHAAETGKTHYITEASCSIDASAGDFRTGEVRDGSTVKSRDLVPIPIATGTCNGRLTFKFDPPLKATAATAVSIVVGTPRSTGYATLQGFTI